MKIQTMRLLVLCFLSFVIECQTIAQVCKGSVGDNIFPDGDFGSGAANIFPTDPGIAAGYRYAFSAPPNDGSYTITNNTTPWGGFAAIDWIDIKDNSSDPNGYMMVVNASFEPGLFYERTVPVCGNTNYEFSADVISMNDPRLGASRFIAPNISFLINGTVARNTGDVPIDARWHTYGFTFNTPPDATEIKLSLRNNAPGGFGNDLALDNVTFRPCGPTIAIIDSIEICSVRPTTINSTLTGEAFANPVFQWQVSTDQGNTWTDIPNATARTIQIPTPADGQFYRLAVASSPFTITQPTCRIVSNVARVSIQPLRDTFDRVVCKGDTLVIANQKFFQNGTTNIPSVTTAGCDSIATINIKMEDLSDFKIEGDSILCKDTADTLRAERFAQYNWSTGATSPTLRITTAGVYAVTVTSVNNCVGKDTIQTTSSEVSDFTIQTTPPLCSDGKDGRIEILTVTGDSPPFSYAVNGNSFQNISRLDSLSVGNYTLITQNVNGCKIQKNVLITAPPVLTVELGGDTTLELGDSIRLNAIANMPVATYTWQPLERLSCMDCEAPFIMPLQKTNVKLLITNALGCKAADSIKIFVQNLERIYAPNAFSPNDDGINDVFQLFTGKGVEKVLQLHIFDRWGNQLFTGRDEKNSRWDGRFNGKPASPGVYVWTGLVQFIDQSGKWYKGEVTLIR
jgi:gliding motility-associated-like protein